jgi:hypothetical protein
MHLLGQAPVQRPKLWVPKVEVPGIGALALTLGGISEYGRELVRGMHLPMAGDDCEFASFSDYLELKVLDHIFNDGTFTVPSTVALALCTTVPTDVSTGANIVEATYTGYGRLAIAASDMSAAAAGSKTNSAVLTFAACTGSSSTIIAWATCDSSTTGAGNMLCWGTATSTVISTTQTPATIAASGLNVSLD